MERRGQALEAHLDGAQPAGVLLVNHHRGFEVQENFS